MVLTDEHRVVLPVGAEPTHGIGHGGALGALSTLPPRIHGLRHARQAMRSPRHARVVVSIRRWRGYSTSEGSRWRGSSTDTRWSSSGRSPRIETTVPYPSSSSTNTGAPSSIPSAARTAFLMAST